MGIVIGLLILSIMMIVHELGHYLTGRKLGFDIEEFSIFMGPVLFSWHKNGIKYSLKLLPIGASVRFAGEYQEKDTDEKSQPGHFYHRPKWARALVISTGPALNLLSGVLAFLIMFSYFGYTVPVIAQVRENTLIAEADLTAGDRIVRADGRPVRTTLDFTSVEMFYAYDRPLPLVVRDAQGNRRDVTLQPQTQENYRLGISIRMDPAGEGAVIEAVDADSNAGQPVLEPGDLLLAANGVSVLDQEAFARVVQEEGTEPLAVEIVRDGETRTVHTVAGRYEDPLPIGMVFQSQDDFLPAIGQSVQWTWSIVKVTVRSIGMLFSGALQPQDALAGPVGVVSMIGDVVSQEQPLSEKVFQLLWMFALISVSLGFMNLLPIPPLDGNHLILIGVEAIRGKRLSMKTQNIIGMIGIALIIMLALMGLTFDLLRLTGR